VGTALTENDWLMAVRSRASIPGGTCSFDLPSYYAWQHLNQNARLLQMQPWIQALAPMNNAIAILLRLIRDSGTAQKMVGNAGQFQQYIPQGKPYQLARIRLADGADVVPETAVNRLLVTVRFVQFTTQERPRQATQDVMFELTLCT
jgi:cell division protein ZapD